MQVFFVSELNMPLCHVDIRGPSVMTAGGGERRESSANFAPTAARSVKVLPVLLSLLGSCPARQSVNSNSGRFTKEGFCCARSVT